MEPVSLELLNPTLSEKLTGKRTYTLAISFEDVQSSVHYQEEFVEKLAPAHADVQILDSQKASEFWDRFYKVGPNGALKETSPETKAAIKIGVVNLDVIKMIQESGLLSDTFNLEVEAHCGLGHGLCQVYISGASEDIVEGIHYLRNLASELGGYATIKHLPLELRQKVDVWGENPSYFFLLEGIKTKVDPNRLLNPKRFVGGI
jgi:glycolate oxidase FAD binding subunit